MPNTQYKRRKDRRNAGSPRLARVDETNKDQRWLKTRQQGKHTQKRFDSALRDRGLSDVNRARCTDHLYLCLFGRSGAKEIRSELELDRNQPTRSYLDERTLAIIERTERLATEMIQYLNPKDLLSYFKLIEQAAETVREIVRRRKSIG